jgi:excisionase family DNA binding protein
MTKNEIPAIMTFSECKKILKVGKNTLLNLLHSGELDGFMIGNRWRITRDALIEYVNNL